MQTGMGAVDDAIGAASTRVRVRRGVSANASHPSAVPKAGATFIPGYSRLANSSASWLVLEPPEQTQQITCASARTPTEELLSLPFLQPDRLTDSLHAYQLSKRANSLRVMAEAVRWGKRGARVNTISPGIVITPLARDELTGPGGAGYRRMIEDSVAGRAATPDEVATRRAADGPGWGLHHGQRHPHGRGRDGCLLVRRCR
jgi:NAD(P)-dependent dehydrogenase (short-subunit alcohol dehydrogenase family)